MRNAFADEVTQTAKADPRVVLLSGDIGNRLFDKLRAQSPNQFLNWMVEVELRLPAGGLSGDGFVACELELLNKIFMR